MYLLRVIQTDLDQEIKSRKKVLEKNEKSRQKFNENNTTTI